MDKNLAGQMAFLLRQSSDLLVHLLWLVKQHGTEEEYLHHENAVAHVLTELGVALLYPIYHQYPDLEPVLPPDWKSRQSDEAPSMPEDPITDKELAAQMAHLLQQSSGLLNHLVWLAKHHYTEERFLAFRRAVAQVMGELGFELLFGFYNKYPDLEPVLPPDSKPTQSGEAPSRPEDPKGDP